MVHITRALAEVLVDLAADSDPDRVTTGVSITPAGELEGADGLPPETPVFTDFYFPTAGDALDAVFGIDLSTPARSAEGLFVSHPLRELSVTKRDDLAQVIFVAVPPWTLEEDSFGAFDRHGTRRPLEFVDAEPPAASLADDGWLER
ncbi:hypothetical protein [Halopiger goleimassiliensis]|uniref:hypothetical protein n=1 Tax=Halopiger goleimassiliensis TaxID=1293048 RepID=UPI000677FF27|nr:hypothetical protein [Halopiger goleimassiliensis]